MKIRNWKIVKNYEAVDAKAYVDGSRLGTELTPTHYSLARFCGSADGITAGKVYRVDFEVHQDEGVNRQIFYSWQNAEGKSIHMGHLGHNVEINAPEGAVGVEVTVCFFGKKGGKAELGEMEFTCVRDYVPHIVRLAAAMPTHDEGRPYTIEENIAVSAERIDAAARERADLVVLTETYNTRHVPGLIIHQGGARMDDPAITMLRDKAIEHKMFVAASVRIIDENDLVSNTVVIFDRKGELVGKYTKTHLTMSEIWGGNVPGTELPVFDTEIGRIGVAICWDLYFPELSRVLFLKGVDIIVNPTAGICPWAHGAAGYCNGAIIVTAQAGHNPELTRITDRHGNNAATADPETKIAVAEFDINADATILRHSAPSAADPRHTLKGERRPDLYGILVDPKQGYNY